MAICVFFLLVFALAVLPFLPAFTEWRRKKDAEPLRVVRKSVVDVRHFANGFRAFINARFSEKIAESKQSGETLRGNLDDGTPYIIVGEGRIPMLTKEEQQRESKTPLVLSGSDLKLPESTLFSKEIYAEGSVTGGEKDVFRAVLSENEIHLGRGSTSLRWLHAARAIYIQTGSVLWGRASADEHIRIERGCHFERLFAPRIEFCHASEAGEVSGGTVYREQAVLKPRDFSNRIEVAAGRWLVFGNMEVPPGKIIENDIVATGRLRLGPGVRVTASVKSRREMQLEKGVEIEGSVVSEQDIYIGPECRIGGPVLTEETMFIRNGTRIGSDRDPTTVSAERLFVEPGVVTHGTVWAHVEGYVASPDEANSEEGSHE
jgi:cytoskeletal protein CcmA (bactofilin family)